MIYTETPSVTHGAAVFPDKKKIKRLFTFEDKYKKPYVMYKRVGKGKHGKILVPRAAVPLGETDLRADGISVDFVSSFKPRDKEQKRIVKESWQLLKKGESFILQAVTGKGKTVMSMQLIANVGKRTLILVTKSDIRDQWVDAAKKFLGLTDDDIGFIQGNQCEVAGKKIVIAMIQSMSIEDRYPPSTWTSFGFFIIDECHRLPAEKFSNAAWIVPAKLRLGLSATPKRKDGKFNVLHAHIGEVKVISTKNNVVPRVVVRQTDFELPMKPQLMKRTGKWEMRPMRVMPGRTMGLNKMFSDCDPRNRMMGMFTFLAYDKGRHILVMADTQEQLLTIKMACISEGVPARQIGMYTGETPKDQLEMMSRRPVVLCTNKFTSEGTNIPTLDTIVLASPYADVEQIVGRILRESEDGTVKKEPLVLDVWDHKVALCTGYYKARHRWYMSIGATVKLG